MILAAKNERHKVKWVERLNTHTTASADYPNGSFAPVRPHTAAAFYVDGQYVFYFLSSFSLFFFAFF